MVAVMAVNNETGAIQPIAEAVGLVREWQAKIGRRIHFHCDAVQAFTKTDMGPALLADTVTISGHKIGSRRGVGALRARAPLPALAAGGGQEQSIRPGTENVDAIVSLGARAGELDEARITADRERAAALSAQLMDCATQRSLCVVPTARLQRPELFSPFIVMLSAPGAPAEVIVRMLSDRGVYVSRGSACGSRSTGISHVLEAMRLDRATASGAIRVSLGGASRGEDIDAFFAALDSTLRELAPVLPAARAGVH